MTKSLSHCGGLRPLLCSATAQLTGFVPQTWGLGHLLAPLPWQGHNGAGARLLLLHLDYILISLPVWDGV